MRADNHLYLSVHLICQKKILDRLRVILAQIRIFQSNIFSKCISKSLKLKYTQFYQRTLRGQYGDVNKAEKDRKSNLLRDAPSISASLEDWKSYIENLRLEDVKALRRKLRGVEYLIKIDRILGEPKDEAYQKQTMVQQSMD